MALTVVTDASAVQDSRTLSWTIPTLAVGDVVVVAATTWDSASTLNVPTGTGLSFTQRVFASTTFQANVYIWTAVASSGGSSVAVTSSILAGGSCIHNGSLYVCPTADGYSLATTPNTLSSLTQTSGQGTLAGTAGSLGIVAAVDWNGTSGASRTWAAASAIEDLYQFSSGNSTQYGAHGTLTGASTTVGLSAPSGGAVKFTTGAIEVLASGGGAPSLPPIIVLAPRRH